MTEIKPSKEFVKEHLRLSKEFLEDAKRLFELKSLRSAVDRAYYAMYHAAQAILLSRGIKAKTHKGTILELGRIIVEKGIIPREYGKWFAEALDIRLSGTYNIYAVFGEEIAEELIERAEKFVKKVEELLEVENT
jgi:hypothetical protein